METKKHIPPPIRPGRWSGRGTKGIIPTESFSHETLKEAVAIIQNEHDVFYFDENGLLHKREAYGPAQEMAYKPGDNLLPSQIQTLRAAIAIIANTALVNKPTLAPEDLVLVILAEDDGGKYEKGFSELTAYGYDYDLEMNDAPYMGFPWPLEDNFSSLENRIQTLRDLDTRFIAEPNNTDIKDKQRRLMREAIRIMNETLLRCEKDEDQPIDYWRFHNQYPEAVNFLRVGKFGKFLMRSDGCSRSISHAPGSFEDMLTFMEEEMGYDFEADPEALEGFKDTESRKGNNPTSSIADFVNSYWFSLIGNLKCKADPALLHQTRTILKTHPLREPSEMVLA